MRFKLKKPISSDSFTKFCRILENSNNVAQYVSSFEDADSSCLSFFSDYECDKLKKSKSGIVLVHQDIDCNKLSNIFSTIVLTDNPMSLFIDIVSESYNNKNDSFTEKKHFNSKNQISICDSTEIFSNVTIYTNTTIRSNCRVQSSSVIGAIGLAYASNHNKLAARFPHLGGVLIEDNVDIGANVTIVKGILKDTCIGSGTKIGNNVNIGHNVVIGNDCFISSGVTLAGSVVIEDNCWLAPSVTVTNKTIIRKKSFIGVGSLVNKDTIEGGFYAGSPARKVKSTWKI